MQLWETLQERTKTLVWEECNVCYCCGYAGILVRVCHCTVCARDMVYCACVVVCISTHDNVAFGSISYNRFKVYIYICV